MEDIDEILRKLNINDVNYEFGLDVKKNKIAREVERKTDPKKYVTDAQKYFDSLIGGDTIIYIY